MTEQQPAGPRPPERLFVLGFIAAFVVPIAAFVIAMFLMDKPKGGGITLIVLSLVTTGIWASPLGVVG